MGTRKQRTSARGKKKPPSKQEEEQTNNDQENEEPKSKRAKKEHSVSVGQIHADCFEKPSPEECVAARSRYDHQGVITSVVWPAVLADYQTNSSGGHKTSLEWTQACQLVVVLLSTAHAHSGGQQTALQIIQKLLEDASTYQTENGPGLWKAFFETIITSRGTGSDMDYPTLLVHFCTLVWSAVQQPQLSPETAENDYEKQKCWLKQAWMEYVEPGVLLWRSQMPKRQQELYLKIVSKEDKDLFNSANDIEPGSKRTPLVSQVVQRVIQLVEGDSLKLGKIRFNTETGTDDEDDAADKDGVSSQPVRRQQWLYIHRVFELLLDLLHSPETRQFVAVYLTALHFTILCRNAVGSPSPISFNNVDEYHFLAQKLLQRLQNCLESFPTSKMDGKLLEWSVQDQLAFYHRRGEALQRMCHRHYADVLPDLIYAGVGALGNRQFVKSALGALDDKDLFELLAKMRLMDHENRNGTGLHDLDRDFLLAVLDDYLTRPQHPVNTLESVPLYPTESVLWDFSRIPPSLPSLHVSPVLSLPKLQLQFLSFADYLLRNFELSSLSSAYEIRSDLVDSVKRLRPVLRQVTDEDTLEPTGFRTEFSGWSRMALETEGRLELKQVEKPLLGERHPSKVTAEVTVDLQPCGDAIRREWDELGEFDNLFLVSIDASKMTGQSAPTLSEYHLTHGTHRRWDNDGDRRVPDEDDHTFPRRFGVTLVRGCMINHVRDEEGNILSDPSYSGTASGTKRIFRVSLDPAQYSMDAASPGGTDIYDTINLLVRRQGKENNFKAVLETIRGLIAGTGSINRTIPTWLQEVLLGRGDPKLAYYKSKTIQAYARSTAGVANPDDPLDFGDTFLDEKHLRESFEGCEVSVDGKSKVVKKKSDDRRNFRVCVREEDGKTVVEASSYRSPEGVEGNRVPFSRVQVEAIRSGLSPGLTVVVGPPGTGKTDVAVQIISCLFHSFPTQRTIVITHSNAALNDIFQKVMSRGDVDERYLVRLGSGERDLQTDSTHDFTKAGRVAFSLGRRGELLEQVQLLSESLGISGRGERGDDGSPSYTCETAEYFYANYIRRRIKTFQDSIEKQRDDADASSSFPFNTYFKTNDCTLTVSAAQEHIAKLQKIFDELTEYRPLELLRSQRQRTDYLLMKQARVVAMTCTHAAIARSHLISLGFEYDNVVVEEAGQMTEIENFIPLLLQKGADDSASGVSRLKRVCLMGDHNQLPPVIKNMSFSHHSSLDQSLFSRMIRLGVHYIQLDKQGRARPDIAELYNWRYESLGNLDHVTSPSGPYGFANPGFVHTYQLINVDKFEGKGETAPTSHFYQNIGEAEYAVALFQYMVLIGYSPDKVSILTTYNGQKALISDIVARRCGPDTPLAGVRPRTVSTVDQYQGQQSDYIILSLVRTESVGHLRDIRRLVVAVSRSRLGLYVLCRQSLFSSCQDLKKTFDLLAARPSKLQLVLGETFPTERRIGDEIPADKIFEVEDTAHLGSMVHEMQQEILQSL